MTETQPAAFEIPHRKVKEEEEEEEERVNIIPLCQENGKKKNVNRIQHTATCVHNKYI